MTKHEDGTFTFSSEEILDLSKIIINDLKSRCDSNQKIDKLREEMRSKNHVLFEFGLLLEDALYADGPFTQTFDLNLKENQNVKT
jgi:hypothetical protein